MKKLHEKYVKMVCCCICLCDIHDGKTKVSPCNHVFHSVCIEEWNKKSNTCPLCRGDCNTNIIYKFSEHGLNKNICYM